MDGRGIMLEAAQCC